MPRVRQTLGPSYYVGTLTVQNGHGHGHGCFLELREILFPERDWWGMTPYFVILVDCQKKATKTSLDCLICLWLLGFACPTSFLGQLAVFFYQFSPSSFLFAYSVNSELNLYTFKSFVQSINLWRIRSRPLKKILFWNSNLVLYYTRRGTSCHFAAIHKWPWLRSDEHGTISWS